MPIFFRQYDYIRLPLVPPGTRFLAYLKPDKRRNWSPHDEEAWTIFPTLDHYQCLR